MYVAGVAIFINNIFMDYDAHRTCMHIRYRQYKIKDKRFSIHSEMLGAGEKKIKKKEGNGENENVSSFGHSAHSKMCFPVNFAKLFFY